ncbi:AI-2E family transporter [Bradyrhizobium sp. 41S5]|uniref:AI-2E family transporter n=1 Tax=Bradyrhizobium sp. 41S5 TaxID=1404443 RepID=UPI00156AA6E1|nr:AI-2E family transporter [Bradyrhizobium sp. 41S5]UFX48419.1 AI-2E family transporter [Bradyrhizobium sp. 41S5]
MLNTPEETQEQAGYADRPFVHHLLLVVLGGAVVLAAWRLSDVLILAFGTALLALLLRGLARLVSRWTPIPEAWAVGPVVVALLALFGAVVWRFGSQIATQFDFLVETLPKGVSRFVQEFGANPWGGWLLGLARDMNLTSATGQAAGYIAALFGSVLRATAYIAVLLFAAVYLAAQPERYRHGLLQLVPQDRRERIGDVLDLMGTTLGRWLIGQSVTMAFVGTLTAFGLWLLGIAAPLALGLTAGMFAFVPYVGPILASAPGILIAAVQGPMPALYAAALYGGVHFAEGNLVTPLVQAEAVELPPVLTLFATVVFGLLLGPVGVLLATPLMVVILVLINTLYLEDVLGEPRAWPSVRKGDD